MARMHVWLPRLPVASAHVTTHGGGRRLAVTMTSLAGVTVDRDWPIAGFVLFTCHAQARLIFKVLLCVRVSFTLFVLSYTRISSNMTTTIGQTLCCVSRLPFHISRCISLCFPQTPPDEKRVDGHAYYSSTFVWLTLGGYNHGVMMRSSLGLT